MKKPNAKATPEATGYRALVGLSYGDDRRAETGDVVYDLPPESIAWLLEQGQIEPAREASNAETRA